MGEEEVSQEIQSKAQTRSKSVFNTNPQRPRTTQTHSYTNAKIQENAGDQEKITPTTTICLEGSFFFYDTQIECLTNLLAISF